MLTIAGAVLGEPPHHMPVADTARAAPGQGEVSHSSEMLPWLDGTEEVAAASEPGAREPDRSHAGVSVKNLDVRLRAADRPGPRRAPAEHGNRLSWCSPWSNMSG